MTVCGTGGWSGALPGDPDNNVVLSATPAFGGIQVSWSYPETNSHAVAHTLLFRGTTANFSNAIQRQVVAGSSYYDMIPTGITYFYWIKIVSINGTVGTTIGPASATANLMVDDLITQLTGQIDEGVLATSLKGTLDNISIINGNLNNEIFDRETGETSFATALADVAAGVAEVNTFITTEISSRVTADSAIAEQISLVAATAGDDVAAVTVTMNAWIGNVETLEDTVSDIGALYTANVTVNGLVGGFGIYNNGTSVQAGFDVDTFWVGRTSGDKRKPFIIDGGVVYIDNAMINQLSADRIDTRGLTIKDALGNVIFGSGNALDWSRIGGTGKAADGATRNVYRGEWASGVAYVPGDIVLEAGYGWSAILGATSSGVIRPPTYPITSNTYWTLHTIKGADGSPGANGTRTAILDMYRNSVAAPTTFPVGNSTYTWATGQFTDPPTLNGWSRTPPAPVGGQDLYVVRQLFSDTNTSAESVVGWAADTSRVSAASGEPGADGINGARTAFLELYQWATATPTLFPVGSSTYTWATGAFTLPATPNLWSLTPGAQTPGQTLWACSVRLTNNTTVTNDVVNWSGVSAAYPIGAAGSNGAASKTVTITASSQVFQINKALAVSPASITFTAYGQNVSGSPTFSVIAGTATLSGTGNTRALAYAGLTSDTATIQVTWDSQVDTITVAKIREGADGANGITGVLSNESHTVPTDPTGVGGNFTGCATTMSVFNGTTDDSANWTVTATPGTGVTGSLTTRTYTVTALSVDTSFVDLTATRSGYATIVKRFTITKSKTGITGSAATAYWMMRSAAAVSKSLAGVMTPATVTFSAMSQTGASAPAAYAGKFVIANSTDGTTFSDVYASVTNESSKAYTILGTAKAVRIRFYLDVGAGASTLLDEEVIPVVTDGPVGNTGLDGLTVILSNEAHTLPAGSDGVVSSHANSGTTVVVYEGTTALTASASAVVSAFRIGAISQLPLSTLTPGGVSYATTVATVAAHSNMVAGTDSVVLTLPITVYRANGTSVVINKIQTLTKSKAGVVGATGAGGLIGVLSNEAHVLPAAADGTVSAPNYAGSGTQIRVYEGATELQYDGFGVANGTWTMSSVATNITRGGLSDLGSYLVVADHSGVAAGVDISSIVYTLTGKSSTGVSFTMTRTQSFSKSKSGVVGDTGQTGPAGPTVVLTSDRFATFTATDGVLDGAQANIVLTATTQGLTGPTFAWSFSGLQSNPTASTTSTQTITSAQFGTSKAAIITCTVNGLYVDKITIVRLEKSTAAAGATVGAPAGTLVNGIPVADITSAVANFNTSNDRNSAAVVAPTIPGTLAVEHTLQTDGSADVSFDWLWGGNEGDIDGFIVFVRQSTSASTYAFGTTPAEETAYNVPANKRAFIVFGTAVDKYYTFGVQAYRLVDKDINASGVIKSALVKVTTAGMDPYRPSATVAFSGNVTGTIDGSAANTVRVNAANALANAATAQAQANTATTNAATAQTAANTANTAITNIASDNILSPGEKPTTKLDYDTIIAEQTGIGAQATAYGVTTEKTTYDTAVTALTTYLGTLTGWNTIPGSDVVIVGTTFRSKFQDVYVARQALLNNIAANAKTLADAAQAQANTATTNASTAQTTANTAVTNAATAQTTANTANSALADIASDSKFTPVEKQSAKLEWAALYAEKAGINASAAAQGITTENDAYNAAFTALANYLHAGTWPVGPTHPSWIDGTNLGTTTDITGSTFRTTWAAVYSARQALLNKIAEVASTKAVWSTVSGTGRPADNATVGATIGVNLGGQITAGNASTFIANAAIGNAQIGGVIQSDNFVTGVSGWRIQKTGDVEFGSGVFRGTLTGASGSFSGTLTASNIVDTAQIVNNAVTIPISAYTAGGPTVSTAWTTTQTVSINALGNSIFITGCFYFGGDSNNAGVEFEVLRDGSFVYGGSIPGPIGYSGGCASIALIDTPATGSRTYTIRVRAPVGTAGVSRTCLTCIGIKK